MDVISTEMTELTTEINIESTIIDSTIITTTEITGLTTTIKTTIIYTTIITTTEMIELTTEINIQTTFVDTTIISTSEMTELTTGIGMESNIIDTTIITPKDMTELSTEINIKTTIIDKTIITTTEMIELTTEISTTSVVANDIISTELQIITADITIVETTNQVLISPDSSNGQLSDIFQLISPDSTIKIFSESSFEALIEPKTEIIENEKNTEVTEEISTNISKEISSTQITEKTIINKNEDKICRNEDFFNNGCSNKFIENEKIGDYYNEIKNGFINNNYKGNNTIIKTKNVVFQISKLEEQENANDPDVSSVDLGTCEEKLKSHYSIPEGESLIIYKLDIKTDDLIQTYVQYEVYEPMNMNPLNLSICKDDIIKISSPVKLNNLTSSLYDNLKESGYDLFNQDDPFYHDICTVYTTENGTDMILLDRKEIIYNNNGNISLCQTGCELESYNSTNKKAICNCSPQHTETKTELSFSKDNFNVNKIKDSFVGTLRNSNFLVLKCYKLAFDIKDIGKNIGRIFMTIIVFLSLVFLIIFCLCDFGKIIHCMSSIFDFFMKNKNTNTKNNKKVDIDIFNNNTKDKKKTKSVINMIKTIQQMKKAKIIKRIKKT